METVTTIGFDIAKSVFQVHGVDAAGQVVKLLAVPIAIGHITAANQRSQYSVTCHSAN